MALPFLVTSSSTAIRRAGPQRPLDRRHPPAFPAGLTRAGRRKILPHGRGDASAWRRLRRGSASARDDRPVSLRLMYLVVTRLVSWMVDLGGTEASPRTGAHTGSD